MLVFWCSQTQEYYARRSKFQIIFHCLRDYLFGILFANDLMTLLMKLFLRATSHFVNQIKSIKQIHFFSLISLVWISFYFMCFGKWRIWKTIIRFIRLHGLPLPLYKKLVVDFNFNCDWINILDKKNVHHFLFHHLRTSTIPVGDALLISKNF